MLDSLLKPTEIFGIYKSAGFTAVEKIAVIIQEFLL